MPASRNIPALSNTSIRTQLKLQTSDLHRAVEAAVDITAASQSLDAYIQLLKMFWSILQPLESALAVVLEENLPGYYPERRRSPGLEEDLAYLGFDRRDLLPGLRPPAIGTLPDALGALYVVEGSTLGGQIIARHLNATLGLGPDTGASFFHGYGEQTGTKWQEYLRILEQHATENNQAQIIGSAQATFERFLQANWRK